MCMPSALMRGVPASIQSAPAVIVSWAMVRALLVLMKSNATCRMGCMGVECWFGYLKRQVLGMIGGYEGFFGKALNVKLSIGYMFIKLKWGLL